MSGLLEANEAFLRIAVFLAVFSTISAVEAAFPARNRRYRRRERWPGNIALNLISNGLIRFAMPLVAVEAAIYAEHTSFGFFNFTPLPFVLEVLLCLVLLDLVIYGQHLLFHRVPLLWRLHKVHHTDRDLDATSALRFHPIEIIISMVIKIAAVLVLGASAVSVILFEIILNGMALFNHGNFHLPKPLEGPVRAAFVTPDMHRVHHSVLGEEHNRNFGFNLSCWDRWFGTYLDRPKEGHEAMTIGLSEHQTRKTRGLWFMLALPFRPKPTDH